ncbi:TIGR02117 family protein [Iningainema tapete]|uniref:TIGR02117 family protein n=1 Tax=Iningainema tapete BLCC-T55 TaxID=2748662 RepID=A0A8J7BZJ2_9CYAN|nr:TIGR02117 family protein [Iningainema tapete]MBD2776013.1 TIGR02117 family protein [Iningainema tapete BLCC-T55]
MGSTLIYYQTVLFVKIFTYNKVFSRTLYFFYRYFFAAILACLVLAAIGALLPRKWSQESKRDCNLKICVANTGIHTNIIVPTKNQVFDWHGYLTIKKIGVDNVKDYNYLSFGWGDRDFYLSTPTLADLQLSTTLKALFLPTPSVIYIKGYQLIPDDLEVKCVNISNKNYLKLINYIQTSFQVDAKGRQIRIANGHTENAGFYTAIGSYSILRNCNSWTAEGLREADINTPVWDGFSYPIMWQLRSGCE